MLSLHPLSLLLSPLLGPNDFIVNRMLAGFSPRLSPLPWSLLPSPLGDLNSQVPLFKETVFAESARTIVHGVWVKLHFDFLIIFTLLI